MKKSLILISILYSSLSASAVDSRFSYQDYLDFGANKGRFEVGAIGFNIISKDKSLSVNDFLSTPMVDFGASNETGFLRGEFTNVGNNKVLSAAHMVSSQDRLVQAGFILRFGGVNTIVVSASNDFSDYFESKPDTNQPPRTDIEDFVAFRMSKVNLNQKANVTPLKFYDNNNKDMNYEACLKKGLSCDDKSGKAVLYDSSRYTIFARSGTGTQKITEKKDDASYVNASNAYFTGGLTYVSDYKSYDQNYGLYMLNVLGNDRLSFTSTGSKGDSGSALYVWDNVERKWYMVGVASSTDCSQNGKTCTYTNYHLINSNTTDTFYDKHKIITSDDLVLNADFLSDKTQNLENTMGALSFKHYYVGNEGTSSYPNKNKQEGYDKRVLAMANDKDIYINGGSLTLNDNADLGSSALIFSNGIVYDINGDFNFLHGGLDIGSGSTINYHTKTAKYDYLHKIGDGKLNVYSSSADAGLRIGGGEIEFKNALGKSFGSVYMTNNSSLKINNASQIDTNYLYFGKNAGRFDLNGVNLSFYNLNATDNQAIITNTSKNISTINIFRSTDKNIFHGQIDGNIKITQNGNNYTNIYDGGLKVNEMGFSDGTLVFQGHPVVHNYVSQVVKSLLGEDVFTSPTRLDQKDWEDRTYQMTSLNLENANLDILKHSNVQISNITANASIITIGDNIAYIDGYDGENIDTSSANIGSDKNENYMYNLSYKNNVSSGVSENKNLIIKSDFNLLKGSKLSILNGTSFSGKIVADDTSSLDFKNAIINANIKASNLNSNSSTYVYENSLNLLDITKSASGTSNNILIKKSFLNGADKILLASLPVDGLVAENYFSVAGESSVFSDLEANVKHYTENGVTKWYIERKSTSTSPTLPDLDNQIPPTNQDGSQDKPSSPDDEFSQDQNKPSNQDDNQNKIPFDPNPNNNLANTETIGHYDDYFFVKENTKSIQSAENSLNQIFFNYVLEWNNMQKRMGELRDDSGSAGVWLRAYGGESKYLDYNTTKYYEMQLGADKRSDYCFVTNYTGLMFITSFYDLTTKDIVDGKIKGLGAGIYSSFLYDNGFYFDMIAKYTNYKNDFNISLKNTNQVKAILKADNKAENIVASVEFGYRHHFYDRFFIEPSLEFITGYIGEQKIKNEKEYISLDMKSFVPFNIKPMIALGKTSNKSNDYGFRLGVGLASDMVKNGDKVIRDINVIRQIEGKKDSRMLVDGSLNYNLSDKTKLNLEFEKTFFGDMDINYAINFTIRKSF